MDQAHRKPKGKIMRILVWRLREGVFPTYFWVLWVNFCKGAWSVCKAHGNYAYVESPIVWGRRLHFALPRYKLHLQPHFRI